VEELNVAVWSDTTKSEAWYTMAANFVNTIWRFSAAVYNRLNKKANVLSLWGTYIYWLVFPITTI